MEDLLTTRQLQDLLHVDRITIYRMLNDGRLTGFKVGGQWRFSRREIEAWLHRQQLSPVAQALAAADEPGSAQGALQPLPLACVQAIQSIYAEALDVAAITLAPNGEPLTEIDNSCAFCDLVLSTEAGRRRCVADWEAGGSRADERNAARVCHAGLLVAAAPVRVEGQHVATAVACQFSGEAADSASVARLAAQLGLHEAHLQAAAASIRVVPEAGLLRIPRLVARVADTFAKIGQERLELLTRLRRIAEMTNV